MERKKVFALKSLLCFVHHLSFQAVEKKNLLASKISLLLVFFNVSGVRNLMWCCLVHRPSRCILSLHMPLLTWIDSDVPLRCQQEVPVKFAAAGASNVIVDLERPASMCPQSACVRPEPLGEDPLFPKLNSRNPYLLSLHSSSRQFKRIKTQTAPSPQLNSHNV